MIRDARILMPLLIERIESSEAKDASGLCYEQSDGKYGTDRLASPASITTMLQSIGAVDSGWKVVQFVGK
jgi:hypothetical protein